MTLKSLFPQERNPTRIWNDVLCVVQKTEIFKHQLSLFFFEIDQGTLDPELCEQVVWLLLILTASIKFR